MKINKLIAAGSVLALALAGCSSSGDAEEKEFPTNAEGLTTLVVGATPTPHGEILQHIIDTQAKDAGLDIQIKEFNDYVQPNAALSDGSIDANYFQHKPYLDEDSKKKGYDLTSLAAVHLEPLGAYSQKVKSLKDLPEGAKVGVPNDPTNEARALKLLVNEGVIELKDPEDLNATPIDITSNPKNIEIVELEAPQVARSLGDLDAAIINSNFALINGLDPVNGTIATEKVEGNPYANILVVRTKDKDNEKLLKLKDLLCSTDTQNLIKDKYQGTVVPAC